MSAINLRDELLVFGFARTLYPNLTGFPLELLPLICLHLNWKDHLNMIVFGHVDCGKSTIVSQLLSQVYAHFIIHAHRFHTGALQPLQREGAMHSLFSLNEYKNTKCNFNTNSRGYTIFDVNTFRMHAKQIIAAAMQCDAMLLVISARKGEFEAGFDRNGMTKQHIKIATTAGISRVVVAVNKMDLVQWDEHRYNGIKNKIFAVLQANGFKKKHVRFVPIAARNDVGIAQQRDNALWAWYTGDDLLQTLDSLKPIKRAYRKPLRLLVAERKLNETARELQVDGVIKQGVIRQGDKVVVMQAGLFGVVGDLKTSSDGNEGAKEMLCAGENVSVSLQIDLQDKVEMNALMDNVSVFCHVEQVMPLVDVLKADVYFDEMRNHAIITCGWQGVFHWFDVAIACELEAIPHRIHPKTLRKSRKPAVFLRAQQRAIVQIRLKQKCVLETNKECPALSRFFLLDQQGQMIGFGKVTETDVL